jgi:hypothetical protein
MNANSVPMLVISPTMSPGMNAAKSAVKHEEHQFDLYGVWNFGCTSEKTAAPARRGSSRRTRATARAASPG